MEVKIIQGTKSLHYGGKQTHIFECVAVTHEIIDYKDRENFLGIYNDRLSGEYDDKYVLGIPEDFFDTERKDIGRGQVLLLTMGRGGSGAEKVLCMDCKVYITSKGQTIDTVNI